MRSIGLRFAFLGAAAALLAVLGVYALFTGSDSGSGTVSAGTVVVLLGTSSVIGDASEDITITYDGGGPPCPAVSNMGTGDTCDTGGINVFNGGTLDFDYTVGPFVLSQSPTSPPALDCWDITFLGPADIGLDGDLFIVPGGREVWDIEVTLLIAAPDTCQGMDATLGMEVTATQVP